MKKLTKKEMSHLFKMRLKNDKGDCVSTRIDCVQGKNGFIAYVIYSKRWAPYSAYINLNGKFHYDEFKYLESIKFYD